MKIIHRFILCLGIALFLLAACEGGFVEPQGRLIVENKSPSASITSVKTKHSSVWLERWTGSVGLNERITLKLDPGTYTVQITVEPDAKTYTCDSVIVPEGNIHLVFNGETLQ
jgi:hypothetical protein